MFHIIYLLFTYILFPFYFPTCLIWYFRMDEVSYKFIDILVILFQILKLFWKTLLLFKKIKIDK